METVGASKAALYVDFDNFFGGLLEADPKAALDVVHGPAQWVARLREAHTERGRRWLVLRCYMNPSGWVPHPAQPGERLYFSKFRPFFSQAGFEIVDCPSLTRSSKNGADIRMTVDIMTALRAPTRYDEVVIASSDSDFTHLLHVVRADDRRIVMIATSGTAVAYQALADIYLDEQDVLDLMRDPEDLVDEAAADDVGQVPAGSDPVPAGNPASQASGSATTGASGTGEVDWQTFADEVRARYEAAEQPVNLARWSSALVEQFGHALSEGRWFGTGGFARALERVGLEGLSLSQHFAWDARRHVAPEDLGQAPASPLPAAVARFCHIAQLPRIPSDRWPIVFRTLESYAMLHEFQLAESTRWSRDHAAQQGADIPRSAFGYVVRACIVGGAPLNADPTPTANRIGDALLASVLEAATRAGLDVTEDETAELRGWLGLDAAETH